MNRMMDFFGLKLVVVETGPFSYLTAPVVNMAFDRCHLTFNECVLPQTFQFSRFLVWPAS